MTSPRQGPGGRSGSPAAPPRTFQESLPLKHHLPSPLNPTRVGDPDLESRKPDFGEIRDFPTWPGASTRWQRGGNAHEQGHREVQDSIPSTLLPSGIPSCPGKSAPYAKFQSEQMTTIFRHGRGLGRRVSERDPPREGDPQGQRPCSRLQVQLL